MRFRHPVLGPRIVPLGEAYLPTDVLPNGRPAFRVTDTAAGHLKRPPYTAALDVGNRHGGDSVVAMAAGTVIYTEPREGIVRLDHGDGWTTGYAHMEPIRVTRGQQVPIGFVVGNVGNAGTALIHLHFDITRNGVRLDPWPLLAQNQEEDMKFREPTVTEQFGVKAGTRFTRARDGSTGVFTTVENGLWSIAEGTLGGVDSRLIDYGSKHELLIVPRSGLVPVAGTRMVGTPAGRFLTVKRKVRVLAADVAND